MFTSESCKSDEKGHEDCFSPSIAAKAVAVESKQSGRVVAIARVFNPASSVGGLIENIH